MSLLEDAPNIVVMGTMDTKGAELCYLAERINANGGHALLMDVSTSRATGFEVDITPSEIAAALDRKPEDIHALPRGEAVSLVCEGAAICLNRLVAAGEVQGVVGAGGSGGTTICASAMRELPYGVPKLIVSTLAHEVVHIRQPWLDDVEKVGALDAEHIPRDHHAVFPGKFEHFGGRLAVHLRHQARAAKMQVIRFCQDIEINVVKRELVICSRRVQGRTSTIGPDGEHGARRLRAIFAHQVAHVNAVIFHRQLDKIAGRVNANGTHRNDMCP